MCKLARLEIRRSVRLPTYAVITNTKSPLKDLVQNSRGSASALQAIEEQFYEQQTDFARAPLDFIKGKSGESGLSILWSCTGVSVLLA